MMRETSSLEFKQCVSKTFLKTVSAFANYGTGRILFGVDDSGESIGLSDPVAEALRIEHMINDSLDPLPRYSLEIDDTNSTICLTVFEGVAKPFFCSKKAYRRADSSTVEVDRVELTELILAGQNLTFDELPSRWKDFSFDLLAERFSSHMGLTSFDNNTLRTLGLMSAHGAYVNAAEILSDSNGLSGVDIVKFGTNISEILERKTVRGRSVLEQYDACLDMYERYCTYERVANTVREKVERIPNGAFREAVANALVHRSWNVAANVTIAIHEDRVVVTSPGGLPRGVSEAEYLGGGVSIPRNPILANVFFRLDYIEQFGTGIPRINQAYEKLSVKPGYEVRQESIVVTLPFDVAAPAGLSEDESLLLKNLSRTLLLSRADIEKLVGFSKDKTLRLLNALTLRGFIQTQGQGRSKKYRRV